MSDTESVNPADLRPEVFIVELSIAVFPLCRIDDGRWSTLWAVIQLCIAVVGALKSNLELNKEGQPNFFNSHCESGGRAARSVAEPHELIIHFWLHVPHPFRT